jgi:antitoxin component HigA of HigAB toxin-antitoxin module
MPSATYEDLLVETLPSRIETDEQAEAIGSRFGELLAKRRLSAAEEKLKNLLGVLIQDYDRRHALPPDDSTPAEILQFLVEHSGKKASDLLPIFGQRSHVNEALNGKRKISVDQARKLGKLFSVKPGLFI